MSDILPTNAAIIPNIPSNPVSDPQLRPVIDSIKTIFNTRAFGKNEVDRWVTWRDLVDNQIVVYQQGDKIFTGNQGGNFFPVSQDPEDYTPPPQPTGFTVTPATLTVLLEWDDPQYTNFSYAEIWRGTTSDIASAVLNGTTSSFMYADAVGAGSLTYYYWVRFVSKKDVAGPYNAVLGTGTSTNLVGTVDLGPLVVTAAKIASGAIDLSGTKITGLLQNNSLAVITDATKIADSLIGNTKLANLAVDAAKLADSSVTATKIASLAVGTAAIQTGAITTALIANAAVGSAQIATAAITSALIADAAVGNAAIANAAITNAKIANLAVDSAKIADASIVTAKIADANITDAKIALATITGAKIASATIGTANITNGAITTALIGDAQILTAKIADAAITNVKIFDATITGAKIANATIGTAQIANAAIVSALIADASIVEAKIADAAIGTAKIQDAVITNAKIANAAITNAKIGNLEVDTIKIAGNAVSFGGAIVSGGSVGFYTAVGGTLAVTAYSGGASYEWNTLNVYADGGNIGSFPPGAPVYINTGGDAGNFVLQAYGASSGVASVYLGPGSHSVGFDQANQAYNAARIIWTFFQR